MLKVLCLVSEVAPFAKTGGLADVGGSLPKALRALGHDVRVVMPAYRSIEQSLHAGRYGLRAMPLELQVPMGTGLTPAGVRLASSQRSHGHLRPAGLTPTAPRWKTIGRIRSQVAVRAVP